MPVRAASVPWRRSQSSASSAVGWIDKWERGVGMMRKSSEQLRLQDLSQEPGPPARFHQEIAQGTAIMKTPDYEKLFRDYAAAYTRSLGDKVDSQAIRAFFAESFIGAGVNGQVKAGANDEHFEKTLE